MLALARDISLCSLFLAYFDQGKKKQSRADAAIAFLHTVSYQGLQLKKKKEYSMPKKA